MPELYTTGTSESDKYIGYRTCGTREHKTQAHSNHNPADQKMACDLRSQNGRESGWALVGMS